MKFTHKCRYYFILRAFPKRFQFFNVYCISSTVVYSKAWRMRKHKV